MKNTLGCFTKCFTSKDGVHAVLAPSQADFKFMLLSVVAASAVVALMVKKMN